MDNISRRRFARMLAGVPFIGVAARGASATTQGHSLTHSQVEAVELMLRRLVDSSAVPGISVHGRCYSHPLIGHRSRCSRLTLRHITTWLAHLAQTGLHGFRGKRLDKFAGRFGLEQCGSYRVVLQ